jgi:hypothetical protein
MPAVALQTPAALRLAETHRVCRPAWICAVDAAAWPCPVAREALAEAHDGDPDRLLSEVVDA